jgi:hypothetical protein
MGLHFNRKKLGVVVYVCHPSYVRKLKIGGLKSRLACAKKARVSPKYPEQKGLEARLNKPHKHGIRPQNCRGRGERETTCFGLRCSDFFLF